MRHRFVMFFLLFMVPHPVAGQDTGLDRCRAACVGYSGGKTESTGFKACLRDVCGIDPDVAVRPPEASDFQDVIDAQIAMACDGAAGKLTSDATVERDFDGDGKIDLLLSHDGIECGPTGRRSLYCGAQVCSLMIYLSRDDGLDLKLDGLGLLGEIDDGTPPVFTVFGHGGTEAKLQWDGSAFSSR